MIENLDKLLQIPTIYFITYIEINSEGVKKIRVEIPGLP